MAGVNILITFFLVSAVMIGWVAFILGYRVYDKYRKETKISRKLYLGFFIMLTIALILFIVLGVSKIKYTSVGCNRSLLKEPFVIVQ